MQFVPDECILNTDDFYGDRGEEIAAERRRLRYIQAEEGDTVTLHFTVSSQRYTALYIDYVTLHFTLNWLHCTLKWVGYTTFYLK